jgi:hypothetical protein
MGLEPSPYQAVQGILMAEKTIRGDPANPTIIFKWKVVELNLPGSDDYRPWKPWVSK